MNLEKLLKDKIFVKTLDESVESILKDNKINEYDIPEIVFIITTIINTEPKLKLNRKNLGDLIKELFNYILKNKLKENDEMTEEQKNNLNKLIDSSIKLILLKPNYSKINNCLNRILYCK